MIDFEDFNEEVFLKHEIIIVVTATHYEGDPCDNTKKFFKWIREKVRNEKDNKELFKNKKFVVFGLGDTSYEQYNAIGKYFNESFEKLGGERLYRLGEANAEGNHTEDDFNEWKKGLWRAVFKYYADKLPK